MIRVDYIGASNTAELVVNPSTPKIMRELERAFLLTGGHPDYGVGESLVVSWSSFLQARSHIEHISEKYNLRLAYMHSARKVMRIVDDGETKLERAHRHLLIHEPRRVQCCDHEIISGLRAA